MAITVECEHCGARLKLKNESMVGKQVPCPKCNEKFTVEPIEEDEFEVVDEEEEPAPKAKKGGGKSSKGKGRKGKKSGDGAPVGLIVGGIVLLLLAVGAGVYFLNGSSGDAPVADAGAPAEAAPADAGGQAPPAAAPAPVMNIDLAYLPPDTDVVLHVKLGDLIKSPLIAEQMNSEETKAGLASFQETFGLAPDQIKSITLGVPKVIEEAQAGTANAADAAQGGVAFGALPLPPGMPAVSPQEQFKKLAVVIRSAAPMDLAKVPGINLEQPTEEVGGVKIYTVKPPGEEQDVVLASAKPDVLIASGSIDLLKASLAATDAAALAGRLGFIGQQDSMVVLGGSIDRLSAPASATSAEGAETADDMFESEQPGADPLAQLRDLQKQGIQGGVLAVNVTDSITIRAGVHAPGKEQRFQDEFQTAKNGMMRGLEMDQSSPEAVKLLGNQLLSALKFSSGNGLAILELSLTKANLEQIQANALALLSTGMQLQMGMAMGGGGGGPPDGAMPGGGDGEYINYGGMRPEDQARSNGGGGAPDQEEMARMRAQYEGGAPDLSQSYNPEGVYGAVVARQGGTRKVENPVALTQATNLPEGIEGQVAASATQSNGQPALGVDLLFKSGKSTHIVGYSSVKGSVKDQSGAELLRVGGDNTLAPGPNSFAPVDRVSVGSGQEAASIPLAFQGATEVSQITSGSGSVLLRTAAQVKDIQIPDVHSAIGPQGEGTEPANLGVRLERGADGQLLLFSMAPDAVVTNVKAMDANGQELTSVSVRPGLSGNAAMHVVASTNDSPLPVPLMLKAQVASQLTTAAVDYSFGTVSLPAQGSVTPPTTDKVASERKAAEVEGGTITGYLRWGPEDERKVPMLEAVIDMSGPPFENAIATGRYDLDDAKANNRKLAQLKQSAVPAYMKRPSGFDAIDRKHNPMGGCEAFFAFARPRENFEVVTSLSGSVKVRRATSSVLATFPSVESLAGQTLQAPELEAAKLELKATIEGDLVTLSVEGGDPTLIRAIDLLSADGVPMPTASTETVAERRTVVWKLTALRPELLSGAGLRIELHSDVTDVNVPFLFKTLKAPAAPSGTNPQQDYQPEGIDYTGPMNSSPQERSRAPGQP